MAGDQRNYSRGRDRMLISTAYIPRPGEELPQGAVPYGYQGKGNRLVSRINGETFFYVVTLRAPIPGPWM